MTLLSREECPERIRDVEHLEEVLSRPTPQLLEDMKHIQGDLIILGASGKVGPTLARMAKRAAPERRVVAVARFSDGEVERRMRRWGIETVRCDLFERAAVQRLPWLPNVIYMVKLRRPFLNK